METQNRTNWHVAASIADRHQSPPLTARLPSVEGSRWRGLASISSKFPRHVWLYGCPRSSVIFVLIYFLVLVFVLRIFFSFNFVLVFIIFQFATMKLLISIVVLVLGIDSDPVPADRRCHLPAMAEIARQSSVCPSACVSMCLLVCLCVCVCVCVCVCCVFSFGRSMSVLRRWRSMASTSRVSCWSCDDLASTKHCQASRLRDHPLPYQVCSFIW